MNKQYTPDEIKELRNSFTKIPPITQVSQNEIKEKQYRSDLAEFLYKNPSANEKRYIEYRIIVLEKVLGEYYETADMYEGEDMDGKELLEGNLITTKMGTASDYWYCKDEFDFFKDKFQELTEPKQIEAVSKEKSFMDESWFKVGLSFATGEIYKLLKNNKGDYTATARELLKKHNCNATEKELKSPSYRPYISESKSNTKTSDKNIFSKPDKLVKVYNYCIENKIVMCNEFLNKYDQIEPE